MRGEPKTKVMLTIFRKDENRTFPVTITREEIRTQSVRSKVIEPGYAWIRLSQFQERTVDDFVTQVEADLQAGAQPQGPGAGPAQRPGRPAGCRRGRVGGLSARKRDRGFHQRPAGRKQVHLQGLARVLPAPQWRRPAQTPAGSAQDRAAGGAGQRRLGLGQRNRGRRPAGPQARHHHGQPDLRQGLGADRAPARAPTPASS